jgi:probable F420-dependent oxidoreductase
MIPTAFAIPPHEVAQWAEGEGFDSFFVGEHSHIPVNSAPMSPGDPELPVHYRHFLDPFASLASAAVVTKKIKLGTAVCVVTEHHPISLAKAAATVDVLSGGRMQLGIGAGWNVREMTNYGVRFEDRWKITRERVLAMKEIWTKDEPEFHGKFVDFGPIWCWPKPVQKKGLPLLLGAWSAFVPKRVVEYCDGWITSEVYSENSAAAIKEISAEAEKRGRSMSEIDLSVLLMPDLYGDPDAEKRVRKFIDLGFSQILFLTDPQTPAKYWPVLEWCAKLMRTFR